ncbi:MAG: hypothetical protein M0D54_11650 [Hyphomonadaceae bacterium JAD_PAG50586_4]|nr:MAG: hypothetical protein M0D54_11650 [Hyphomonadaceae bacterium JAD_PAG50586_4]
MRRLALGALLALSAWLAVLCGWTAASDDLSSLVGMRGGGIEGIVAWVVGGFAHAVCLALVVGAALFRSRWPLFAAFGWGGVSEWMLAGNLFEIRRFVSPRYLANGPVISISPQAFEQRVDLVVFIHVAACAACTAAVYWVLKTFDENHRAPAERSDP